MKSKYQKTLIACYLGFITQAITANFAPLLFFDLSSDVSDFTWKDSFYFNGIFLYAVAY